MSEAWDRITDENFKSWLLEDMTVEEYNELGPVDRRTLRSQFQQRVSVFELQLVVKWIQTSFATV